MSEILQISPIGQQAQTVSAKGVSQPDSTGFGEMLKQSVKSVDGNMKEADEMVKGLVSGQHANIHETMIALEKANVSFRLLTKVQQKVIEAYRETMRMQV